MAAPRGIDITKSREQGPQREVLDADLVRDDRAVGQADEVVVRDQALVRVEERPRLQA